jgi:hypothetical protein
VSRSTSTSLDRRRPRLRDRQIQRRRPRQRVMQRLSQRSSPFVGRLTLVLRQLLGLVRNVSLPRLLALPQHGASQLHDQLQLGSTNIIPEHLLVRSRS